MTKYAKTARRSLFKKQKSMFCGAVFEVSAQSLDLIERLIGFESIRINGHTN